MPHLNVECDLGVSEPQLHGANRARNRIGYTNPDDLVDVTDQKTSY